MHNQHLWNSMPQQGSVKEQGSVNMGPAPLQSYNPQQAECFCSGAVLSFLFSCCSLSLSFQMQTMGNHDIDFGPAMLGSFIGNLSFPMLGACNIDTSGEPALRGKLKQFVVLQHGSRKVCCSSIYSIAMS